MCVCLWRCVAFGVFLHYVLAIFSGVDFLRLFCLIGYVFCVCGVLVCVACESVCRGEEALLFSLFFLCFRESVCDGGCILVLFGLEVSFVLCSCLLFPGLVTLLVGVVFGGLQSDDFLCLCGVLASFACMCGVLGVTLCCCMGMVVGSFPIGVMFLGLPKGGVAVHD